MPFQAVLHAVEQHGRDSAFQVLGVAEDDLKAAKRAMKQLSLKLHPDKGGAETEAEAYDAVAHAWDLLKPRAEAVAIQQV